MNAIKLLLVSLLTVFIFACGGEDSSGSADGTAGSTSRFAIQKGYLFVAEQREFKVFTLQQDGSPSYTHRVFTTATVETLFAFGDDLLFSGTTTGAFIFKVQDDGKLQQLAFVSHTRSCDPVVANQNYMYVTLREGRFCGQAADNALLIYDIENLSSPKQLSNTFINRPEGLALDGNTLYVCYAGGMQVRDVTDPADPKLIHDYSNLPCKDVITEPGIAFLTGEESVSIVETANQQLRVFAEIKPGD